MSQHHQRTAKYAHRHHRFSIFNVGVSHAWRTHGDTYAETGVLNRQHVSPARHMASTAERRVWDLIAGAVNQAAKPNVAAPEPCSANLGDTTCGFGHRQQHEQAKARCRYQAARLEPRWPRFASGTAQYCSPRECKNQLQPLTS